MKEKIADFLSNKYLLLALRLGVGFVFIIASIGKIIDPVKFMDKVYEYALLPDMFVPAFSYILPWIEFFTGLMLMLNIYAQSAAFICCGTLVAFITAIFVQISRGVSMDCGCFDFLIPDEQIGYTTIARDFSMLLVASVILVFDENKAKIYGLYDKVKKLLK